MSYFGKLYLDKEKDIVVTLDMENGVLGYTISANNHRSDNLINNLAAISGQETVSKDGKTVIVGEIPCYIKGDGKRCIFCALTAQSWQTFIPTAQLR